MPTHTHTHNTSKLLHTLHQQITTHTPHRLARCTHIANDATCELSFAKNVVRVFAKLPCAHKIKRKHQCKQTYIYSQVRLRTHMCINAHKNPCRKINKQVNASTPPKFTNHLQTCTYIPTQIQLYMHMCIGARVFFCSSFYGSKRN